jgi:hypothetical protein
MSPRQKRRTEIVAVSIPEHVWTHPAYRALQPVERVLLVELLALARQVGTDEPLVCSSVMAGNMCKVSWQVARRALLGLRKKGFIVIVKSGVRRRGAAAGLASEYLVTCLPYQGELPTADYNRLHWKAFDKLAPAFPEASLSNAPARTSETASESPELGAADSKSAYMAFTSERVIHKLLKEQEKNIVSGKSGMLHQRIDSEPISVHQRIEHKPAKLPWSKPVVRYIGEITPEQYATLNLDPPAGAPVNALAGAASRVLH